MSRNEPMNQESVTRSEIAPHEALELHELLASGIVGYKKTQYTLGMVQDSSLRQFMEQSLEAKKKKLTEIRDFMHQKNMHLHMDHENMHQNNRQHENMQ